MASLRSLRINLEILMRRVIGKAGGVGVPGFTPEQYIAVQVKAWSNGRERLLQAQSCFADLMETLGKTTDLPRKADMTDRKESHDTLGKTKAGECLGEKGQEEAGRNNGKFEVLVCGITKAGTSRPTGVALRPHEAPIRRKRTPRKSKEEAR